MTRKMKPIYDALASLGVEVADFADGQYGKDVFHVAMRIKSFADLERIARAIPLQFSADKRHADAALHSLGFVLILRGVAADGCLDVILESLPMTLEKSAEVKAANIERLAKCICNANLKGENK